MIKKTIFSKTNIILSLFLISCLLTRLNSKFFIIDIFGHFGLQIFLFGAILFIVLLLLKKTWSTTICFLACSILAADILYSCNHCNFKIKNKTSVHKNVRLMTFNASFYENCKFYKCITCINSIEFKRKGCIHNKFKDFDDLLNLIKKEDPDIINFQEISPIMQEKIHSLKPIYPYSLGLNRNLDIFDSAIISKYPFTEKSIEDNHILRSNLIINQTKFILFSVHLIKPGNQTELRLALEGLEKLKTLIKNTNQNIILIGDLNMTWTSKRFTNFLNNADLYTYLSYKEPTYTWPAFLPNYLGLQLDHVLFSKNLKMIEKKTANNFGSDHRPLLVDLTFR